MFTEVSNDEIRKAITAFRDRIARELPPGGVGAFRHPGGDTREGARYDGATKYGLLTIFVIPDDAEPTRYIHGININRPNARDATLRLSTSKAVDGIGKASTVAVRERGTNELWMCHLGDIRVHRDRPRRAVVLDYFHRRHHSVVNVDSKRKPYPAIKIGALESPSLFDDIALFAKQMEQLKAEYREGGERALQR